MPGTVYHVPPIPPDPAHTVYVEAGPLRIGIEHRVLDDADLEANYQGEAMAEIEAAVAGQDISDNGVSLHVFGAADGHEYLRFDMFEREPHYHYIRNDAGAYQTILEFDRVAHGEMLPWALEQLRTRLVEMLRFAGAESLIEALDARALEASLPEVERLAVAAEAELAAARRRA